jgi:hypothetical protein
MIKEELQEFCEKCKVSSASRQFIFAFVTLTFLVIRDNFNDTNLSEIKLKGTAKSDM